MNLLSTKNTKRLAFLLLCCILCSLQGRTAANAAVIIDNCRIEDGFTPPEDETIVFYLNNASAPYTSVANKVQELLVGEHHRFTVAANKREEVSIRWSSSNPEVAEIVENTGELTALSVGKTVIQMEDSANGVVKSFSLTVNPMPVLPEIPEEWYEVGDYKSLQWKKLCPANEPGDTYYFEEAVSGVRLALKKEYRSLFQQCSMLRFPEEVDGKKVLAVQMDGSGIFPEDIIHRMGFRNLKMIHGPNIRWVETWPSSKAVLEEIIYPADTYCLSRACPSEKKQHIPESTVMLINNATQGSDISQIRVPANVKMIGLDRFDMGYPDGWDPSKPFCIDGNNTNYYSIFGVLFSYPVSSTCEEGFGGGWWVDMHMHEKNTLMLYPVESELTAYRVPDGVEAIARNAFYGAKYLKKIVLPDSVTELGENAFAGISHDVEIVIPASVTVFVDEGWGGPFGIYPPEDESMEDYNCPRMELEHLTIVTPKGSAAEAYAMEHGIKYRNK